MKKELFEFPDISYHNGTVNIKKIRDAGSKTIGVRCGYGKNNIDQKWTSNATAMVNLRVDPLIYWFSYAYTEEMAKKEADYCCNEVSKYWKQAPICFDFEYDSVRYANSKGVNIDSNLATKLAIAFLKRVKERGYYPVLYTNRDYLGKIFNLTAIQKEINNVKVWYARYNKFLTEDEENLANIWQYTSKGSIDGVTGNVDLNKYYITSWLTLVSDDYEKKPNINISSFQSAFNWDAPIYEYGDKLDVTGIEDVATSKVRKKLILKAKYAVLTYVVGSKGALVKWLQRRLNEIMNEELKVDGLFGADTRRVVINFQKKYNLKVDGVVGKETITALFWN